MGNYDNRFTSTIYGHIKNREYKEAIEILLVRAKVLHNITLLHVNLISVYIYK